MKLLRRKDMSQEPLTPWAFVDTIDSFHYNEKYQNKTELLEHIARYRSMNNMEPLLLADVLVEDYMCRQPGMDRFIEEYDLEDDAKRTISQYLSGAAAFIKTAMKTFTQEEALASEEEARSRALMCLNCGYNKPTPNKGFVAVTTDSWMTQLTEDKSTPYDAGLHDCQKCGCPLKPKIWIDDEVLALTTTPTIQAKLKDVIIGRNGRTFRCWAGGKKSG